MRRGLVHRTIIIPGATSLPLFRGAKVGRAPTIFQNDWILYQNLQFFQSSIFSIAVQPIHINVAPGPEHSLAGF